MSAALSIICVASLRRVPPPAVRVVRPQTQAPAHGLPTAVCKHERHIYLESSSIVSYNLPSLKTSALR